VGPLLDALRRAAVTDDPAYRSALLGVAFLNLSIPSALQDPQFPKEALVEVTSTLALRSLLAATYRNPAYAEAYAYLGQALDQLGWGGWARASLQTALRLAPQSPVVLMLTGLFWDRRGAPALARHYYEVAFNQDRDNVTLCLEIAATYAAEGEYTAAEVWLLFATEIAPDDPQVWEMLAHFYLDHGIGVEESGLPAATRLLELAPSDARAHDLVGWAFFLEDKDAQAEARLIQALSINPTLASAHYHLGRLYARQGRYAEASEAYRRADDYDIQGQLTTEVDRARQNIPPAYRGRP
jgi:tetratricopeptide (TPR) repeat protein